jgi:Raf kinase inhibitor-like YbhB/YbcL family protein
MLEHLPHWLGSLLKSVRAGHAGLTIAQAGLHGDQPGIHLSSPAFPSGGRLPPRFSADGEGLSPPLIWGEVPEGTQSLALLVEDPDAPAPQPLVHAIIWNLPAHERSLAEGAIRPDGEGSSDGRDVGRNSFMAEGWLPPDPPNGHGEHDYVFQLFALSTKADIGNNPGRSAVIDAMNGHVLAAGVLVGTYSRGDTAPLPSGEPAPLPVAG